MFREQKGITLVALVITIIVLLILAGVTIAALSGPNGILSNATQATEDTAISEAKEAVTMAINTLLTNKIANNEITTIVSTTELDIGEIATEIQKNYNKSTTEVVGSGDTISYTTGGYKVVVTLDTNHLKIDNDVDIEATKIKS